MAAPALRLVSSPEGPGDVVVRARDGEPAAQTALYRAHAPAVRGLLARLLGRAGEVDDALQDTFTYAFAHLRDLRDVAAVRGWLRAIAVGKARHRLRARARRSWLFFLGPDLTPDVAAESLDPAAREAVRATYAALRGLSVEERIAFSLRYLSGFELTEGAAAMGVSLATFKRRLQKAESRFREAAAHEPALDKHLRSSP